MELEKKMVELSARMDGFKLQGEIDPAAVMAVLQEAVTMIDELKMKITEVMGEKEVAEEEAEMVKSELSKIKVENEAKETEAYFELAIKDGKILPVEAEQFKKLYTLDKNAVKELIEKREVREETKLSGNAEMNGFKLDKIDYEIMAERGLDKNNKDHVKAYIDANK